MGWNSVRVRLTLWNVLVLGCVLGGFGLALCTSVQVNQAHAIDRDLAARARGFGPGGLPGRGGPHDHGGPPGHWGHFGEHHGPGPDGPEGPEREEAESLQRSHLAGPPSYLSGDSHRREPGPPRGDHWGPSLNGDRSEAGARTAGRRSLSIDARTGASTADPQRYFERPLLFDLQGKPWGPFPDDRPWDPSTVAPAAGGQDRYSTATVDGQRVRVLSAPLRHDGALVGVVQVAHPLAEQQRLAQSQVKTLLVLIPLALLVAGLGGLFLTNRALLPVRRVTQAAAQIGAEDLSQRLEVTGNDELAELALTFNGMIGRLDGAFSGLAEAYRKLESAYEEQRRFTGDASHELRTPLARIKGSTSLALCGPHDAGEYREALVVADQAADAMNRIVQDLLLLARSDAGQLSPRLRTVLVEGVLENAACSFIGREGAAVHVQPLLQPLQVMGDPDHLTRLLTNLLENAVRHTPPEGEVLLSAHQERDRVLLVVADTGEGIAPEHLSHVCERFYRVDAARSSGAGGTGLGLAICQSIVQAHGGTLSIESCPGRGTTVQVSLPAFISP